MRKPWNRPDFPVYSVASLSEGRGNMNICTYVSAVSMKPKRYMVAFYKGTLTLEMVRESPDFILQLLSEDQYRCVRLLGQQSGHNTDKLKRLREPLMEYAGITCMSRALALIQCRILEWTDAGDHWMTLCEVISFKNLHEGQVLTTETLRQKGIIRA